ncbi:S9 family peptidase [Idiomarina tyrosinivorans]|uniref:S9 family peptidase n=1 Tax=Idiomarina tyrosinivorans TaxID=1445662 RepID=A0A432ZTF5_9GAMM|nr:alpha/beta fold hydrolase [Idiomarina tyrosinivorans]RUO81197.1 S9 family peptidase [Idiomarina tyrosinivorans]
MIKSRLVVAVSLALLTGACASTSTSTALENQPQNTPKPATVQTEALASATGTADLTIEQIMADQDWIGREPQSAFWSPDGKDILFYQKQQGSELRDLYRIANASGAAVKVPLSEWHQYAYDDIVRNRAAGWVAYTFEGNILVLDNAGQLKQLTRDDERQYQLALLADGRLAYREGDALFAMDVTTGSRQQLLSVKMADQPKANKAPDDYIAEEQQKLIQFIQKQRRDRAERFEREQQLRQQNASMTAAPFYLGDNQELVALSLSPNAKYALAVISEPTSWRDDGDIMPNYVAEDGRIEIEHVRRRVADAKPVNQQLVLLDLTTHQQTPLTYNTLPGWNEDVLAAVKRENAKAQGESYQSHKAPRAIQLMQDWYWDQSAIQWTADGNQVAVMLEAWDNKDRWIATVDFAGKRLDSQHRLHDDAWINYDHNQFGWLPNSKTLWFQSEQDGYSHLYTKAIGGDSKQLTKGSFVVENATLSNDGNTLYFKANKPHPGNYEIYSVATNGESGIKAITDLGGFNDFQLSPDNQRLIITHSAALQPPELYSKALSDSGKAKRLTHTVSEKFESIDWTAPSIVAVPSSHVDRPIYSRVYFPKDFDPNRAQQYPAVVFIHGAGYLQNAHMGWSLYQREFMFHSFLNKHGYVVLDLDYRGSKGYGRDWRTAIYRQMGTPEVEDLVDVVDWLGDNAHVDTQRVGTYGGSYGGFLTFMALFKKPGLFQAGSALRPVTDWAHYNTGYTANILNLPQNDPIAYRRSSPIYFADGLQDALLINSPMVDDNVFFEDGVRLVQRLIELEKQDWETAIYPVEPHGFRQPSSWLNEYRRIFKLFEENLK